MSGFACNECGHRFKTIKAAERASFGPNGCPKCGGSDVQLTEKKLAAARKVSLADVVREFKAAGGEA